MSTSNSRKSAIVDKLPSALSPFSTRARKRASATVSLYDDDDTLPPYYDETQQDFGDGKQSKWHRRPPTWGMRVRNFLLTILVMLFPIGIFVVPLLLTGGGPAYPRVVVAVSGTPEQLPHMETVLESLLFHQTVPPDAVYLVLPQKKKVAGTEHVISYEPYPVFLNQLLEASSILQVVLAPWDYGPLTKVLHALEKENDNVDSRIIFADTIDINNGGTNKMTTDSPILLYGTTFVQTLVDASLRFPSSVVALGGGNLLSYFRQINYQYNKFPNVFLQISGTPTLKGLTSVDIVLLSMGVCLRPNLLNVEKLQRLLLVDGNNDKETAIPTNIIHGAADVIFSALLEKADVTKWVVPSTTMPSTTTTTTTTPTGNSKNTTLPSFLLGGENNHVAVSPTMGQNWIQATRDLQQRFQIWEEYQLLDWSQLTTPQRNAIECEAKHEQDCSTESTTTTTKCLPNPKQCPEAQSVLDDLMSTFNQRS